MQSLTMMKWKSIFPQNVQLSIEILEHKVCLRNIGKATWIQVRRNNQKAAERPYGAAAQSCSSGQSHSAGQL